nr:hypothetical protein [Tanacetum cinerariifolium]
MDEALVPRAQRLRIGSSNFRLLLVIKSKESTLQLVYDDLRRCPSSRLSWSQRIVHGQSFYEPPFEEEIMAFIRFLGHNVPIRTLTDELKGLKEYYAIATGEAAPKPKASVRRARSSYDTSITPPTAAASPRLTAFAKGKQTAKASKAKSLSALSEPSGSGADEGTGSIPWVPDVPTDESEEELSWKSTDDEGDDIEEKDNKEVDDDDDQEVVKNDEKDDAEESGDDEEEGEEDIGLNVEREEGLNEEEEEDKIYRDVNINQGMGLQETLEVEDTHVTLTPVKPDDSYLHGTSSYNNTNYDIFYQCHYNNNNKSSTNSSNNSFERYHSKSSKFGSLFRFDDRLSLLEENFSEVMQTNQFAGAVFAILGIVQHYMDQRMNEAVKVAVQIQSDQLRDEAQRENDEFLRTVDENIKKIIKELPHSSRTSYVVAADLSEMELKKILIEKMEGN